MALLFGFVLNNFSVKNRKIMNQKLKVILVEE